MFPGCRWQLCLGKKVVQGGKDEFEKLSTFIINVLGDYIRCLYLLRNTCTQNRYIHGIIAANNSCCAFQFNLQYRSSDGKRC